MNNKRPGEGLAIIIKYLKRLRNWWNLPRPCKKHGREHLYRHGWDNAWDCKKCKDEWHNDNWK